MAQYFVTLGASILAASAHYFPALSAIPELVLWRALALAEVADLLDEGDLARLEEGKIGDVVQLGAIVEYLSRALHVGLGKERIGLVLEDVRDLVRTDSQVFRELRVHLLSFPPNIKVIE